ncbi:MAG: hypothetical protein EA001_00120 [Oscillatoriales cyanobacterium]|nr:MAG: hypothetical protein EA001_00120 [Oscillatoriales cyanobacterium]
MLALETLLQELSTLASSYTSLGTRLSLAAGELSNLGTPPSASLLEEASRYQQTFERLRNRALGLAKEAGLAAGAVPANLVSVRELEAFVRSLMPVGSPETVQQQALSLVDRVLAIRYNGSSDAQAALTDCHNQARQVRGLIATSSAMNLPQVAISLVKGNHPLCALLSLVDEADRLDDDRWVQLEDTVARSFGRSLAVAASRRKLQIGGSSIASPTAAPTTAPTTQSVSPLTASDVVFGANMPSTTGAIALEVTVHVGGIGDRTFSDREFAGTQGESRALEGMTIHFQQPIPGLGIRYMGHLENKGDTPWVGEGEYVGSRGENRRLEGFAIELTGPEADRYQISYQGHFARYGDSNIVKNGEFCGLRGEGLRLEALKVWIDRQ